MERVKKGQEEAYFATNDLRNALCLTVCQQTLASPENHKAVLPLSPNRSIVTRCAKRFFFLRPPPLLPPPSSNPRTCSPALGAAAPVNRCTVRRLFTGAGERRRGLFEARGVSCCCTSRHPSHVGGSPT